HLVDEAGRVVRELLGARPALRVLATSREALALTGEVLLPVPPLAVPDAVELFVERARAVAPTFGRHAELGPDDLELLSDLCDRLDGLPPAIELAAARVRTLPVAALASELADRFGILTRGDRTALPRQQTMRATVDWSYDLLFDDERRVF